MPFKIKPPSSSKTRPALASSETKPETSKRRVGRPRKGEETPHTAAKLSADSKSIVPNDAGAVTRSRAKTVTPSTAVSAPQAPQKKSAKRRAEDAIQAQPAKHVARPTDQMAPPVSSAALPASQPVDLSNMARGLHAPGEPFVQAQSQTSAHSASSSITTATLLSDVQSSFELLVSQYPEPPHLDAVSAQEPALPTIRGPWLPGQRVERDTLGAAVRHLESLGFTEPILKRVFTAQREPAVAYAVFGALVIYTPELAAVGLTPPDIARLAAPSPAPLGRVVKGRGIWQAAGLTVPFLIPVAMHESASPENFGALLRHLSPFLSAGGDVRALLQAYYRNEGPAVFENLVHEQQRVTSTSSSQPQQAPAPTTLSQPVASPLQTSTSFAQNERFAERLSAKNNDEAADDAQMVRQLTSNGRVQEPARKQPLSDAQATQRRLIRDMSDEARRDLGGFSPVLQDMGMSIDVVVQIATQSPLEAPLALVHEYASIVSKLGVTIKNVEQLALRDLSLETLRQFSVQAPALLKHGMTSAQLVAFATASYHVV